MKKTDAVKRKTILKKLLLVLIVVVSISLAVYFGVSKKMYNRSNLASFSELLFRAGNTKEIYSDRDKFKKYIERKERENRRLSALPQDFLSKRLHLTAYGDINVINLRPNAANEKTVVYIHGGTYISDISLYHLGYCEKLARQLDINVLMPLYPLAPSYSYKDAYPLLLALYRQLLEEGRTVVLMGDSAGGGLAAGFCEYLYASGLPVPEQVILFSPWLDVTMSNEKISDYERYDPLLSSVGLIEAGILWAGGDDPAGYMVSPINGDPDAFSQVTLFVGTREVFYPDVTDFAQMLSDHGVDVSLHIGMGLNHIYTEYPIPEAGDAFDTVCSVIGSGVN